MSRPRQAVGGWRRLLVLGAAVGTGVVAASAPQPPTASWVVAVDQSIEYVNGKARPRRDAGIGGVAIVSVGGDGIRRAFVPDVPVSYIGPPTSVAADRLTGRILVASSSMLCRDKVGTDQFQPDRRATLLAGAPTFGWEPRQVDLGLSPCGLSFFPTGGRALVAHRGDGTLSLVDVAAGAPREAGRIAVAAAGDLLSHVEIAPDGRSALASLNGSDSVLLLRCDIDGMPQAVDRVSVGKGPYGIRFLSNGSEAAIAHIGSNEVVLVRIADGTLVEHSRLEVERVPEGIDVAPDDSWLVVSCMAGFGSTEPVGQGQWRGGRVLLFRRTTLGYELAQVLDIEGGPQFAVFSEDGLSLLIADTGHQRLIVGRRSGERFEIEPDMLELPGEPVAARMISSAAMRAASEFVPLGKTSN